MVVEERQWRAEYADLAGTEPVTARTRVHRVILRALLVRAGQVIAAGPQGAPSRKVRAPQGKVLANGQSG